MSIIKNLQIWWTTDPKAKPKVLFIITVSIFLIILFYFIWWLNFADDSKQTKVVNQDPVNQNFIKNNSQEVTNLVDPKSFEDTTKLQAITSGKSAYPHLFARLGQTIYTFSSNSKLEENGQEIPDSPTFVPFSIYATREGLIINSLDGVTIYNGKFQKLPSSIIYLYPVFSSNLNNTNFVKPERYLFLAVGGNTFSLRQANNIQLNEEVQSFGNFQVEVSPKIIEIRIINNRVYIFSYLNYQKQGEIQIWELQENFGQKQISKLPPLKNIQSLQIGPSVVLYTKLGTEQDNRIIYDNFLWDLKENPKLLNNLQIQLLRENIKGNLWATRCTFANSEEFYCLIKENQTKIDAKKESDAVIKYNFNTQKLSLPLQGIKISGSTLIFDNEELFLVGQENQNVYKIVNI